MIPNNRIKEPLLPIEGKRNILITSALPYVNNVPHLGNIVGSVLSGDVFARYCRLRDYQTLYISGTDEYGTATEIKAIEEKCTPQQICDKYHKLHAEIYEWFNIEFDQFGRTTTSEQTEIVHEIFQNLYDNNYFKEQSIKQLYCEHCLRFLADRFVEGICPHCTFEDARGDQCDKCGKLIDAPDLKEPKCKLCKNQPVMKESKHLFFDLPQLQERLKIWYNNINERSAPPPRPLQEDQEQQQLEGNSATKEIDGPLHKLNTSDTHWTQQAKSITETWHKAELKARCVTRDLKWGTKVPLPGYDDKVFYVWFDAPIGYLSITACHTIKNNWKLWWNNPNLVETYQFLGKDNVSFHSIMFPAIQLATGQSWSMVNHLIATDYLNYENEKFSKSRGVGVFGTDVKITEDKIPADIWRFYLMFIRPETGDSSFCWMEFQSRVNFELLNNLGNFINRTLKFVDTNFAGVLGHYQPNGDDKKYLQDLNQCVVGYIERMERVQLRDSLRIILSISRLGNQMMQVNAPWVLMKGTDEDKLRAQSVLYLATNTVAIISLLLSPYMPKVSEEIRSQLCLDTDKLVDVDGFEMLLPIGHKISTPKILFNRVETDFVKEMRAKFSSAKPSDDAQPASQAGKKKNKPPKKNKDKTKE